MRGDGGLAILAKIGSPPGDFRRYGSRGPGATLVFPKRAVLVFYELFLELTSVWPPRPGRFGKVFFVFQVGPMIFMKMRKDNKLYSIK
ncbi:MAG: hypothetical protein LBE49_01825 [Deltaproteobacteria bacterium]|jgi:hypothetical protein|nr:hypothetical protein [Deltaproteobacteria bacterium]